MTRLIGILLFSLFGLGAFAQPNLTPINPYVSDYANLIGQEVEAELQEELQNLRDKYGVEMTVVTIEYSSDHGEYQRIEPFATDLFNSWGVGNKDKNNGILVVVARKERAMRIEIGDGYPSGYDSVAQSVIDNYFLPFFRKDQYEEGIFAGSLETIKRIAEPFALDKEPEVVGGGGINPFPWVMGVLSAIIGWMIFGRKIRDRLTKCPTCGQRALHMDRKTTIPATRETKGEMHIQTTCRHCNYTDSRTRPISRLSSSSSSSSFGGGSSSGGGASGRW